MLRSLRNFVVLTLGVAILASIFYLMMKASGSTPTSAAAGAYVPASTTPAQQTSTPESVPQTI